MYSHYKLMLFTYRESLLCLLCLFFGFRLESSCSFLKSSFLPSICNTSSAFEIAASFPCNCTVCWALVSWVTGRLLSTSLSTECPGILETREQYYLKDSNKQQHRLLTSMIKDFSRPIDVKRSGRIFCNLFQCSTMWYSLPLLLDT